MKALPLFVALPLFLLALLAGASPSLAVGDPAPGWQKAPSKVGAAAIKDINRAQEAAGDPAIDAACYSLSLLKADRDIGYIYFSQAALAPGCDLNDSTPYVFVRKGSKGWKTIGYGPLGAGPGSNCTYVAKVSAEHKALIARTGICGDTAVHQ